MHANGNAANSITSITRNPLSDSGLVWQGPHTIAIRSLPVWSGMLDVRLNLAKSAMRITIRSSRLIDNHNLPMAMPGEMTYPCRKASWTGSLSSPIHRNVFLPLYPLTGGSEKLTHWFEPQEMFLQKTACTRSC